jgi:hypothetical protein
MATFAALAWRDRPWGQWATVALAVLVPMALAGFVGMVISLGSPQLTLIAAGSVAGVALFFVPTGAIVYGLLAAALFGVGVMMYYGHIMQAHWLIYGLCLFLWMKMPIDALANREPRVGGGVLPLSWSLVTWFSIAAVSTIFNATPMLYAMVGARNYVFVWSIAFVVATGAMNPRQLRRCFLLVLVIAAMQLPFAIQQHFLNFGQGASWDSVVGTMGGDPEGGGGSGPLALLAAFAMGLAAALWKRGQLSARSTLLILAAATVSLMLAEVKAFFIFAPVMMGIVLLRELRQRPGWTLGMLVLTAALLGATFVYYKAAYFDSGVSSHRDSSVTDYLEYAISADSALTNNINRRTGEVSRLGAPLVWLQEGAFGGPHARWLGYGMRASRSSPALGKGDAARHFPFSLTTSTITAVLWDLGALGLAAIVVTMALALTTAWRLSSDERIPAFHRGALEASAGAFALAFVGLAYSDALVDAFTIQTLYSFLVGYVMFWQRQVRSTNTKQSNPAGAL